MGEYRVNIGYIHWSGNMHLTDLSDTSRAFASAKKCVTVRFFLEKILSSDHFALYTQLLECDNDEVAFDDLLKLLGCEKKNGLRRLKAITKRGWKDVQQPITGRGRPGKEFTLTRDTSHEFCSKYNSERGQEIAHFFRVFARTVIQYDKLQLYMEARNFKHTALIDANTQLPLVYLADVFVVENDELIVYKKIGCTQDIANRQLTRDMHATCTFTHVFRCIRALPLEQDVLKVPIVVKHLYKEVINGHVSRETIKFSSDFQETDLIRLIQERVDKYNLRSEEADLRTHELTLATAQAENERNRLDVIKNVTNGTGRPLDQQYIIASPPGCPGIFYEHKARKNVAGYRVQRIDPEFPERALAVYDGAKDACCKIPKASQSRIMYAINNHTLYMGSRWCSVSHDLDCNVVHNLPPLQHMRIVTQGMVAKMDQNYVIKEVFRNQRDAMAEAQLKSPGAISNAIKSGTLSRGHYYKLWDRCTAAEKAAYVMKHGEPETPENKGVRVSRMDNTGQTFAIYSNVEAATKAYRMGRKTLYDAIKNNSPTHGWYWAFTDQDKTAITNNLRDNMRAGEPVIDNQTIFPSLNSPECSSSSTQT